MKHFVSISRKWHTPQIEMEVGGDGIAIRMSLNDFTKAVVTEVGSVALTFTHAGFERQVAEAVQRVVKGMKDETIKAV